MDDNPYAPPQGEPNARQLFAQRNGCAFGIGLSFAAFVMFTSLYARAYGLRPATAVYVLCACLGLAFVLYLAWSCVGVPLILLRTVRVAVTPSAHRLGSDAASAAPQAPAFFVGARGAILAEGFTEVDTVYLPDTADNVAELVLLLVNRQTCESACVAGVYLTRDGEQTLKLVHVDIETWYQNGLLISTSNSPDFSGFGKIRGFEVACFPRVRDISQLRRLHLERCRRLADGCKPVNRLDDEFGGDAASFGAAMTAEAYAKRAAAGYLRVDATGNYYRLTIKAACRMAWQNLSPVNQWAELQQDRESERLAAESLGGGVAAGDED